MPIVGKEGLTCGWMWFQVYWFRHIIENDVSRRFDPLDPCSTSIIDSRSCQEVETLLFSNFSKVWEEADIGFHGKACDVVFVQEMC